MSHASCYHAGYALSCAEYDDLLAIAAGCCMICRAVTATLFIDHDHGLGNWAVRGLVCQRCNQHLKCVDAGRRTAAGSTARYLGGAWHLRQASSRAKQARANPMGKCGRCGVEVAVRRSGRLYRHWSRLPGESDLICSAASPRRDL